MKIFYMNQGSAGEYGAVDYRAFDVVLIAEDGALTKQGFLQAWKDGKPLMSVQVKADAEGGRTSRIISNVRDLDVTAEHVRPIATFQITKLGIRVVFVHLKSADRTAATEALERAAAKVYSDPANKAKEPILWIGDFNRASEEVLAELVGARCLVADGGHSQWRLDRAYASGDWSKYRCQIIPGPCAAGDHGHVGIGLSIDK